MVHLSTAISELVKSSPEIAAVVLVTLAALGVIYKALTITALAIRRRDDRDE